MNIITTLETSLDNQIMDLCLRCTVTNNSSRLIKENEKTVKIAHILTKYIRLITNHSNNSKHKVPFHLHLNKHLCIRHQTIYSVAF